MNNVIKVKCSQCGAVLYREHVNSQFFVLYSCFCDSKDLRQEIGKFRLCVKSDNYEPQIANRLRKIEALALAGFATGLSKSSTRMISWVNRIRKNINQVL